MLALCISFETRFTLFFDRSPSRRCHTKEFIIMSMLVPPRGEPLEGEAILLGEVPAFVVRAVRQVQGLEAELTELRKALLNAPAQPQATTDEQNKIADLLSRVILLRLALAESNASQALQDQPSANSMTKDDEITAQSCRAARA
jgi:hypothetical protein